MNYGLYEFNLKICETGKRRAHLQIVRKTKDCEFTNYEYRNEVFRDEK